MIEATHWLRWLLPCALAGCPAEPTAQTDETPTVRAAGDPCQKDGDATCKDEHAILSCIGNTWSETPCRGPEGCKKLGIMVKCDESLGADGEKCTRNGGYACTGDMSTQLKCDNHRWKVVKVCRGPEHCKSQAPFVKCDTTIGQRGDVCEKEGTATCDSDGKTILECHQGHYETKRVCPKICKNAEKRVRCE